ncbi:MAC/perforin domain-containing protein [Chryseobacterium sp. ES2]|uniref:MAC/perforin domain-containing protein n=1 Tax=Chryseobacterium metallicongregator TaxID=3073042 RepID=A0ABU1E108_9FLAO|nr:MULTISPECIES: MAC/perforin domain-containing protein [Chryseobacterium]MDR4951450.1 MAC/perforin domain-containing protein [Chryseobacterium sp. ES2]
MKKQILFSFSAALLLFMGSCSSEDLNNNESTADSPAKTNRLSAAKFAGDGIYDVLGHGFNAAGEYANANSAGFKVIDIERFKNEQAARLLSENTNTQQYIEEYGENAETYSKMVSTKVDVTAGIPLFKKTISVGFNSAVTTNHKFDAKYIYGSYNLIIKQKRLRFNATTDMLADYVTPEFTQDLQTKTPQQIVEDYGTHVMVDIYTGAKMDIMFQSETTNESRDRAARIGVKVGVKSIFDVDVTNDVNTSESSMNYSKKLSYRTRGGDPSKGLVGELNLDQNTPKINIANWQSSSTASNSVLVEFGNNGLVPIYNLVKDVVKKAQLKAYVDQYLIDNQISLEYNTTMLYGYQNQADSNHYFTFNTNLQPSSYWTNEGPTFKVFQYKAPDTVPIYCYKSTSGADHYFTQASTLQPSSYWNVYMGVAFYAYKTPGAGRIPVYSYKAKNGSDHYLSVSPNLGPVNYWSIREGIAFYIPAN